MMTDLEKLLAASALIEARKAQIARLTAERDAAYERAAEVAQQEAETSKRKCDSLLDYVDDFERGVLSGEGRTAKNIAAAIRAMKE